MNFLTYEKTTGNILSIGTVGTNVPLVAPEHEWYENTENLQKWNYSEYLINLKTKKLELKHEIPYTITKDNIISDGLDMVTITLPEKEPNGNKILFNVLHYLNGKWQDLYELEDNTIEFTTIKSGTHIFELSGINYHNTIIEVEAYEN